MKYLYITGLVAVIILSGACKVDFGKPKDEGKDNEVTEAPVEIVSVTKGDISSFIQASTTVKAERKVEIYAEISEKITKVLVEEGDSVRKGQVLAEFDDSELQLLVEKARVNYEKQKSDLERLTKMMDKHLISSEQFEAVRFTEGQAKLDWDQAKLNLSRSSIEATINGVISARHIETGERVNIGTPAFSIVDLSHLTAEAFLPEKTVKYIKIGQEVAIESDSVEKNSVSAVISRINPVVDPQTGTVKITAEIKRGDILLRPGMFVELKIITDTHKDALLIPKKCLLYENENDFVFVVNGNTARKIDIQTGFENAEMTEILSDLEERDKVIIVGHNGLKDGVPVKIIDFGS